MRLSKNFRLGITHIIHHTLSILYCASCIALSTSAKSVWYDKPIPIERGEYLIDSITPNTQKCVVHTRMSTDVRRKADWGIRWGNPEGDYTTVRIIIPTNSKHNDAYNDDEVMMMIERYEDGENKVTDKISLKDISDAEGRPNSIKLIYDGAGEQMRIFAGDDMQHLVAKSDAATPCAIWYFSSGKAMLTGCGAMMLEGKGGGITKSSKFTDTESLMAYIKESKDNNESIWRYLDRNMDEKRADMGGRYKIATVANEAGGYDIIYLNGADTNTDLWQPLVIKGTLMPTIFQGNYDMLWYDVDGRAYADDTNAQYSDDSAILTLRFPALNTQLRFSRLVLR